MKLFTKASGCPNCTMVKDLLKQKGIEFEEINDSGTVMRIAQENKINHVPFAFVNEEILTGFKLRKYINKL